MNQLFAYAKTNIDTDQLHYTAEADLIAPLCFAVKLVKTLISKSDISRVLGSSFYNCVSCFVSDLIENPEDRFASNGANFNHSHSFCQEI